MMNINSLVWDKELLSALGIPISILPEIKPSIDRNTWGKTQKDGPFKGEISICGALVQWMRDNLGMIKSASQIEDLAKTVEDNGDIYFVPAFSGLFAPYWRSDARGIIAGMTRFTNKGHLARAVLEANAYQTRDITTAMKKDSGVDLTLLKVDGGMVLNNLLMQFQSDILNVPIYGHR